MKATKSLEDSANMLAQSFEMFAKAHEKDGVKKGYGSHMALTWLLVSCRDCYGKEMVDDVISTYRKFNKKAA